MQRPQGPSPPHASIHLILQLHKVAKRSMMGNGGSKELHKACLSLAQAAAPKEETIGHKVAPNGLPEAKPDPSCP